MSREQEGYHTLLCWGCFLVYYFICHRMVCAVLAEAKAVCYSLQDGEKDKSPETRLAFEFNVCKVLLIFSLNMSESSKGKSSISAYASHEKPNSQNHDALCKIISSFRPCNKAFSRIQIHWNLTGLHPDCFCYDLKIATSGLLTVPQCLHDLSPAKSLWVHRCSHSVQDIYH